MKPKDLEVQETRGAAQDAAPEVRAAFERRKALHQRTGLLGMAAFVGLPPLLAPLLGDLPALMLGAGVLFVCARQGWRCPLCDGFLEGSLAAPRCRGCGLDLGPKDDA